MYINIINTINNIYLIYTMIKNIYKTFLKKYKYFSYTIYGIIFILIIIMVVYNIYNVYKKLKQQNIYVGCLYSETGAIGKASHDNYKILLDSFKYLTEIRDCPINIIPIYKDLGDDLENFSKWVEECVQKYNIKYFFGCWRSSERRHVLPILEKYNARLFYPLQYEGAEASKYIYYFGACPNQQIIPGLKYTFDHYYYYNDVYIIGSDYSYSTVLIPQIKLFMDVHKGRYNKKLIDYKLFSLTETDFSSFIKQIFNKSPNGAIIINIINGKSYYDFSKQFYNMYHEHFPNNNNILYAEQHEIINFFSDKKIKNVLKCAERYPSISTSIVENDIPYEYHKYIQGNIYIWNFTNNILTDRAYYVSSGDENSDIDFEFLTKFYKKQNRPIGDTEYCSFLSASFFVTTIKKIIEDGGDIYDPDIYDKFKLITITSVSGDHTFLNNNHATKIFYVLKFIDHEMTIDYQGFKNIVPAPISALIYDKFLSVNSNPTILTISDRINSY